MSDFLNRTFLGNTYYHYLVALIIFISGLTLLYLFKKIINRKLKSWSEKTVATIDDLLVKAIEKSILPIILLGVFYISLHTLKLSKSFTSVFNTIISIILTFFVVKIIVTLVNYGLKTYLKKYEDNERREKQLKGIKGLLNLLIWSIALIFLLDNLGVKISAVVAGLGIGGIAVALAAQAVLGDLFSYFVIFFDRPFEIGDFIIVGDKLGVVEHIGIKTTRIRAL
ncbi:mechanosensitive ion channel, partial [candidate division KSB1 bacterium]|nr:mechanosensitive ion channel [candidate division KSB1 bacterium]